MESISLDNLFRVVSHLDWVDLKELCFSNSRFESICRSNAYFQKLIHARHFEHVILSKLFECGNVEYTLYGSWGQSKQHTIRFEVLPHAGIVVKENLVGIPDTRSILKLYQPEGWSATNISGVRMLPNFNYETGPINVYVQVPAESGNLPSFQPGQTYVSSQLGEVLNIKNTKQLKLSVNESMVKDIIRIITDKTRYNPIRVRSDC